MPTDYNVTIELDASEDLAADVVTALEAYHPAAGRSDHGHLEVVLTIPGADVVQVLQTAVAVAARALEAPVLAVEILPTDEWDRRHGLAPVPELVSVTEAADALGVSRQAILQRLTSGSLPGRRVGTTWVIPRAAVDR